MTKYIFLAISAILISGCSLLDSDQPVPSYLIINEVDVITKEGEGAPTHNISDVWVYADNELLGVFELPIRIPVIVDGPSTEFTIRPGIRNNGEVSRSFIYRLMSQDNFTVDLEPGEELVRNPSFTYIDEAIFDFVEGFESTSHIFTLALDDDDLTNIVKTSEDVKSGSSAGVINLTAENPLIAAGTIFKYDGDQNAGSDTYLEMDYKNDIPFFVGLIYEQNDQEITQEFLVINPKSEWNKLYVDFTSILTSPQIENYRIFFSTNVAAISSVDEGTIYLDNLKFIHF